MFHDLICAIRAGIREFRRLRWIHTRTVSNPADPFGLKD